MRVWRSLSSVAAVMAYAGLAACVAGEGASQVVERGTAESGGPLIAASSPAPDPGPLLVALGASLTAGLGLDPDQA